MKICVIGTGYVGLVAGACLSDSGNRVICADINEEKIKKLNEGFLPIFEPGLEELVSHNTKGKRLFFTTNVKEAVEKSKLIFIAVGTPVRSDNSLDMSYVDSAVETIRGSIQDGSVVVIKSTVPVGTADKIRAALKGVKAKFDVISNPEFLKEGSSVNDFLKPERVIIGYENEDAKRVMEDLYSPYVRSGNPILFMNNHSAELAKYAANSFLAMKISFINELAHLCEKMDANLFQVRKALITDSRIGSKFLYAGAGYGGSCFPKDVLALIQMGEEHGVPLDLFRAVHEVNERQKRSIFEKMKRHFGKDLRGKTLALWGISFKPMTDDIREAPAITLINQLIECGVKVKAYDPVANKEAKRVFGDQIELYSDAYEATAKSDALAIMTEWNEFRNPDFELLKNELSQPVIFDGRNLFSQDSLSNQGFQYYCIGEPDPK